MFLRVICRQHCCVFVFFHRCVQDIAGNLGAQVDCWQCISTGVLPSPACVRTLVALSQAGSQGVDSRATIHKRTRFYIRMHMLVEMKRAGELASQRENLGACAAERHISSAINALCGSFVCSGRQASKLVDVVDDMSLRAQAGLRASASEIRAKVDCDRFGGAW